MFWFIVQTVQVRYFMPDYHTDLAFARTMLAVRDRVRFMALPVAWTSTLSFKPAAGLLDIPWDHIETEAQDRGAYLGIFRMRKRCHLDVGSLGNITVEPGYYVYVGSAMRNLDARMARHRRQRKRMHWHVDYLRAKAEVIDILPVRSSQRQECAIAAGAAALMTPVQPGFGCSDCGCGTHLFFAPDNPLAQPEFHGWLQGWRMRPPLQDAGFAG